jgi:Lrp/AsnC family transcriptional regulator, leucine-responsive regulatory protein
VSRSKLLDDPVNRAILKTLMADPRLPVSQLARSVGMSAPAVRERLQRLEDDGVIGGWRVDLDPRALGYGVSVFVRIRPAPGQHAQVAELARRTARVTFCYRVTGDDCFLMQAHLEQIDQLEGLLEPFLALGQTSTSVVQSAPVPHRPLEV